jgi:hypothetical protein
VNCKRKQTFHQFKGYQFAVHGFGGVNAGKDYIHRLSLVGHGNSSGGNTVLESLSTLVTPFLLLAGVNCC